MDIEAHVVDDHPVTEPLPEPLRDQAFHGASRTAPR
jgi:hypothetical protein